MELAKPMITIPAMQKGQNSFFGAFPKLKKGKILFRRACKTFARAKWFSALK
jgi:hypothetical protein